MQSDDIKAEFSTYGGHNQQISQTFVPVQVSVSRTLRLNIVPMVGFLAPNSSLHLTKPSKNVPAAVRRDIQQRRHP